MANESKKMTEKKYVERELSQLIEATLKMEDELNALTKN